MVDFSQARLLDRRWYLKLRLLLDAIEADNVMRLREMAHRQHCAALNYEAGQEAFDHHWEAADEVRDRARRALFPWLKDDAGSGRRSIAEVMREQYLRVFGDPSRPEAREAERQLLERLQRGESLSLQSVSTTTVKETELTAS